MLIKHIHRKIYIYTDKRKNNKITSESRVTREAEKILELRVFYRFNTIVCAQTIF